MPPEPEEIRMLIRTIVDESGLPQAVIARDSGLSYATIRSWLLGHRTPEPESLAKLVAGLRERGAAISALAERLEASGALESED